MTRPEERVDVAVVGAGLAGLACAKVLTEHGLVTRVLEADDAVGGRVRTDHVDGYTLDRGFQVLNTAYPELPSVVDVDALQLRAFDPAVRIRMDGKQVTIGNPVAQPAAATSALGVPVGGLGGKAAFGLYAGLCAARSGRSLKHRDEMSAAEAWRRAGIPPDVVNAVLRPFFAGVLLEQEMSTSRRFTDLMMRMFTRGRSTVPAGGMQRLPEQIAAGLPDGTVRCGVRVHEATAGQVRAGDGLVGAHAVVVAADPWTACQLLPGVMSIPEPRGVTTVYHAAPAFEEASATLLLDADGSPVANSLALSEAAPEYAPPGQVLVATSMVHDGVPDDVDGPVVREALARLHGTDTRGWRLLATYDLPRALPGMRAPHPLQQPVRVDSGDETVYVAGDHRDTSSIQGALVSGRRAAHAVLEDLGAAS